MCILVSYLLMFLFATALTTENVLRVLKGLLWNTLCNVLSIPYSQRMKIEKEFKSEDQRRTAAVNFYLHNHPYASWRQIISNLDYWGVHHKIQHYAEKLTGMFQHLLFQHLLFYVILKIIMFLTDVRFVVDVDYPPENKPPPPLDANIDQTGDVAYCSMLLV